VREGNCNTLANFCRFKGILRGSLGDGDGAKISLLTSSPSTTEAFVSKISVACMGRAFRKGLKRR